MIRVELRCKKHPTYMGAQELKVACEGCSGVRLLAETAKMVKERTGGGVIVYVNDAPVH